MNKDFYFLNECKNCEQIIRLDRVNCPHCGSFQLHIDMEYFDKKAQSFELLAQHREAMSNRICKLYKQGKSKEALLVEQIDMNERRKALAEFVMDQIEEREYYMRN